MDFSYQGLIFGDFSGLPDEEKHRICEVMRPKKAGDRVGVEFPFDETGLGTSASGVDFSSDAESENTLSLQELQELNVHAQEFVPVPQTDTPSNPVNFQHKHERTYRVNQSESQERCIRPPPGYVALPSGDSSQKEANLYMDDSLPRNDLSQSLDNEQASNSRYAKSYERRNKKKRPPGYYNQLECYRTRENSLPDEDEKVPSDLLAGAQGYDQPASGSNSQTNVYPQKPHSHVRSSDSVTIDIEMDDDSVYSCDQTNLEFGVTYMTIENSNLDQRTEQHFDSGVNSLNTDSMFIFESDVTLETEKVIDDTVHKMVPHTTSVDNIQKEKNLTDVNKSTVDTNQTAPVDWFEADENTPVPKLDITPVQSSIGENTNENNTQAETCIPPENKAHAETCAPPVNKTQVETVVSPVTKTQGETSVPPVNKTQGETSVSPVNKTQVEIVAPVEVKEASPAPVSEPAKLPPAPKPTSWAGLFKTPTANQPVRGPMPVISQVNHNDQARYIQKEDLSQMETVAPEDDKTAKQIGNQLLEFQLSHRPVSLQPRGLINRGNWCYVNATLQALLACPPFFNLLKSLSVIKEKMRGPSSTPITDSLLVFVNEFALMRYPGMKSGKRERMLDINLGVSFEPSYVYNMLTKIKSTDAFKQGKQEDAEEFLSCVLNGIHEEMVAIMDLARGKPAQEKAAEANHCEESNGYVNDNESSEEDEEWEQVGPKKKSVITRVADVSKSPVSSIFCGQIRSVLHKIGSRESATLEPFFTLPLDIQSEKVWTVKDALDGFVTRESLQGFTCSKTKVEIEATRRIMLEVLPPVLILHLKCFIYDKDGGIQKVIKKIDYGIDLEVNKDLLSSNLKGKVSTLQRSYKLFAVIYHLGKHAAGGHYTVDIYHNGINGWIRIDDGTVKVITASQVVKFTPPKVPYLLYYRRCDLLSS